ncbi:unnamed protein product [Nippostrongylus brasiliensis]|uniref:PNP_UDP_1 domain-containing protein n=1 Tax=Nippostrongylus brasiliensis TaxID=27835 RepID=A0A0N4YD39_NIPBR|nr:unnamed protein product [Nippostrongylus brasiliensis]
MRRFRISRRLSIARLGLDSMVAYSSLVVLTPIKQSPTHNVVVVHREQGLDGDKLLHVAGGPHTGIIINKLCKYVPGDCSNDVELSFSVWLSDGVNRQQEKRTMKFSLRDDVELKDGRSVVHNFFKQLMAAFPKDYVSFMVRILKQMQQEYAEIQRIDLECPEEDVVRYLSELEALGIASRVEDEWLRVDTRNVDAVARAVHGTPIQPTVAIITCLFVEKQAVDALIEDRSVLHKYKSGGDSNVYTMGRIGQHRVVATKLASIGDSREATTSAGSITTRLLGNFQNIEHVFVVGVGGAVPHFTDAKRHARLGDVIVSASRPDAYIYSNDLIIDRKTEAFSGFAVRKWNPVDHVVSQIVEDGGEELVTKWNEMTDEAVRRLHDVGGDFDFSQPSADTDGAEVHLGPIGAMANFKRHSEENEEESVSALRAKFGEEYELRALDAGFDSVIAAISGSRIDSWTLIRGVADYQHGLSRASKLWQAHAAARAAAMLRVVVERLPAP